MATLGHIAGSKDSESSTTSASWTSLFTTSGLTAGKEYVLACRMHCRYSDTASSAKFRVWDNGNSVEISSDATVFQPNHGTYYYQLGYVSRSPRIVSMRS